MNYTSEESKVNIDILLELYRQANINSRVYINMRYKPFALFVAITAMIGAATFNIPELHPYHATAAFFGMVMTILFWLLDHRTSTFYLAKRKRIRECENS